MLKGKKVELYKMSGKELELEEALKHSGIQKQTNKQTNKNLKSLTNNSSKLQHTMAYT